MRLTMIDVIAIIYEWRSYSRKVCFDSYLSHMGFIESALKEPKNF